LSKWLTAFRGWAARARPLTLGSTQGLCRTKNRLVGGGLTSSSDSWRGRWQSSWLLPKQLRPRSASAVLLHLRFHFHSSIAAIETPRLTRLRVCVSFLKVHDASPNAPFALPLSLSLGR